MTRVIEEAFTWHGLSTDGQERTGAIRGRAMEMAEAVERLVPAGKERERALERLREAMMWANAGISMAFRKDPVQSPASLLPLPERTL